MSIPTWEKSFSIKSHPGLLQVIKGGRTPLNSMLFLTFESSTFTSKNIGVAESCLIHYRLVGCCTDVASVRQLYSKAGGGQQSLPEEEQFRIKVSGWW